MSEYVLDPASGLHYLEFGQGPTLLLLHANGADAQLYLPIIASLASRYRIVAPDLPGHGHSLACKPESVPDYLNVMKRFMDAHIQEPFAVLAHSLGALVSYLLLEERPPETAIWMEPAIFELRPLVKASLPLLARTYALDKHRREPLVKYLESLAWDHRRADPVRVVSFVESYMRSCRQVQSMWLRHYPTFLPWDYSHADLPITCIRGQKNTFISKAAHRLAEALPQGNDVVIPEAGHCLLNENNRAVVQAVEHALERYFIKTGAVQASS